MGYTALLVAGWRAIHAAGPHPLATDDFARLFVDASGDPYLTELLAEPPISENSTTFPRLYGVQTRFFDEFFLESMPVTGGGITQAVILAAGLDSRTYRLDWPAGTVVFEVDRPEVLAFKTRVLNEHGAPPAATRREVTVDLRGDWAEPLRTAGFDPHRPTAWSAEGLLPYLAGPAQDALFTTVSALSAPGSRLAVGALGSGGSEEQFAALEAAHPGLLLSGDIDFATLTYPRDTKTAPAESLARHGWTVRAPVSSLQLQAEYGLVPRPVDRAVDAVLHSEYLVATR